MKTYLGAPSIKDGLISLFTAISTFVGYLKSNGSKVILVEEQ